MLPVFLKNQVTSPFFLKNQVTSPFFIDLGAEGTAKSKSKLEHPLEMGLAEVVRVGEQSWRGRIVVYVDKAERSGMPAIDENRYLDPDPTVLIAVGKCIMRAVDALFFLLDIILPSAELFTAELFIKVEKMRQEESEERRKTLTHFDKEEEEGMKLQFDTYGGLLRAKKFRNGVIIYGL